MNQNELIEQFLTKDPDLFVTYLKRIENNTEQLHQFRQCINEGHTSEAVKDPALAAFQPQEGWTLLMYAARVGHKGLLQQLLRMGAQVNDYCSIDDLDALLVAIREGNSTATHILSCSYLDVSTKIGRSGKSAIDYALDISWPWLGLAGAVTKAKHILNVLLLKYHGNYLKLDEQVASLRQALARANDTAGSADETKGDVAEDDDAMSVMTQMAAEDDTILTIPSTHIPALSAMLRMYDQHRGQDDDDRPMRTRVMHHGLSVADVALRRRRQQRLQPIARSMPPNMRMQRHLRRDDDWAPRAVTARRGSSSNVAAAAAPVATAISRRPLQERQRSYRVLDVAEQRLDRVKRRHKQVAIQSQRIAARALMRAYKKVQTPEMKAQRSWLRLYRGVKYQKFAKVLAKYPERGASHFRDLAQLTSEVKDNDKLRVAFRVWHRPHVLEKMLKLWRNKRLRAAWQAWRYLSRDDAYAYASATAVRTDDALTESLKRQLREYELRFETMQRVFAKTQAERDHLREELELRERQMLDERRHLDRERMSLEAKASDFELDKARLQRRHAHSLTELSELETEVSALKRQLEALQSHPPSLREQYPFSEAVLERQDDPTDAAWLFVEEFRSALMNIFILCLAVANIEDLQSPLEKYMKQAGKILKATGFGIASTAAEIITGASSYVAKAQISQSAQESVKFLSLAMAKATGDKTVSDRMFERVDAIFFSLAWQLAEAQSFFVGYDGVKDDKEIVAAAAYFANRVRTVINMSEFCGYHPHFSNAVVALQRLTFSKSHDVNVVKKLLKNHELAADQEKRGYIHNQVFYIPKAVAADKRHELTFVFYTQPRAMPSEYQPIHNSELRTLVEKKIFELFSKKLRGHEAFTYADIDTKTITRLQAYIAHVLNAVNLPRLAMPHAADDLKALVVGLYDFVLENQEQILQVPNDQVRTGGCWARLFSCVCCQSSRARLVLPKLDSTQGVALIADADKRVSMFLATRRSLRNQVPAGAGAGAGAPAGAMPAVGENESMPLLSPVG